MQEIVDTLHKNNNVIKQKWPWWPLLPLYPYGVKRTFFKEVVPNQIWSFEQLQGLYYVAVPVRLTVVRSPQGLVLINPLPPTIELVQALKLLERKYGSVCTIILPTASGLEHKISMPAMARVFPKAQLWLCPGQWSFPFQLPLSWLGLPFHRTKIFYEDGLPHQDIFTWISLGPLNIGLGRFQEISCFHRKLKTLIVTDALIGIESEPPELFQFDPTPLLFHSREKGDEPLLDTPDNRRKGWSRLVLFSSFLKPGNLSIPSLADILKTAFKPGLRNLESHFGLYPFVWHKGWGDSAKKLIGDDKPLLQIAPVLERLVFPRAKNEFIRWLDELSGLSKIEQLVSAHYSSPIQFTNKDCIDLKKRLISGDWACSDGDWSFLGKVDRNLLKRGVVPENPLISSKD